MTNESVTVVLVEDNDVDVEAVRRGFAYRQISNPIVVASDGRTALDRLRHDASLRPFVVLLDLNLPRMSGLEFLREVRADPHLRDSVIFVLTTSSSDDDKRVSYEHNVAGYILKQHAGDRFVKLTDLLNAYWRIVELPPSGANAS